MTTDMNKCRSVVAKFELKQTIESRLLLVSVYGMYTLRGYYTAMIRVNLHFTLWMCIADDSSKVKGVKAVFIHISSAVNIQSDQ